MPTSPPPQPQPRSTLAKTGKPAIISAAVLAIAIPMIEVYEGTILKTYADPVLGWRVPTACTGHTGSWNGKLLQRGDTWTVEECRQMLAHDSQHHFQGINNCANVVGLSNEEQAAWLDFGINAGVGSFCNGSPARLIREGRRAEACKVILAYKFVGKMDCFLPENSKVCGGIKRRRYAEHNLCMAGAT